MRSSVEPLHATSAPMARSTSIMTSRSATGSTLRSVVTPGASSAAAICLVPAFLVAPETRTVPRSGPPPRTTKESVTGRSFCEAQRQLVFHLGRGDAPHRDGGDDPGDLTLAQRDDREHIAQRLRDLVVDEDLAGGRGVAQPRREV